jgi:hypothetical protein
MAQSDAARFRTGRARASLVCRVQRTSTRRNRWSAISTLRESFSPIMDTAEYSTRSSARVGPERVMPIWGMSHVRETAAVAQNNTGVPRWDARHLSCAGCAFRGTACFLGQSRDSGSANKPRRNGGIIPRVPHSCHCPEPGGCNAPADRARCSGRSVCNAPTPSRRCVPAGEEAPAAQDSVALHYGNLDNWPLVVSCLPHDEGTPHE